MKTKYQIKLFSQEKVEKEIKKLVKIAKEAGSNLSVERNMLTNSDLKFVKITDYNKNTLFGAIKD